MTSDFPEENRDGERGEERPGSSEARPAGAPRSERAANAASSEERSSSENASGEERPASSDFPEEDRMAGRRRRTTRATMADVSHTHPDVDRETVNRPFERGPRVAADSGRRDATARDPADAEASDGETGRSGSRAGTMAGVSHTPPEGSPSAQRVFERGNERDGP